MDFSEVHYFFRGMLTLGIIGLILGLYYYFKCTNHHKKLLVRFRTSPMLLQPVLFISFILIVVLIFFFSIGNPYTLVLFTVFMALFISTPLYLNMHPLHKASLFIATGAVLAFFWDSVAAMLQDPVSQFWAGMVSAYVLVVVISDVLNK